MNRHFFLLSTLLLALWALPAAASDWQDPDSIRDAAEGFVQAQMGDNGQVRARAGNVDQRLRLRRCEQGLETFLPSGRELGGSNTTVGVRCPGPVQWRLFVSVETEVLAPVVVANGVLQRGQVLGPEDISLQERNTGSLRREFFTSPDEVVGMRLRRNLSPGSVIQANHLDIQRLVERGQRVRLL
ncbi:flagellar basal body P-ring formation chaperone FlgA, partial [Natronospira sp.]